jgi:hypothetical protein
MRRHPRRNKINQIIGATSVGQNLCELGYGGNESWIDDVNRLLHDERRSVAS